MGHGLHQARPGTQSRPLRCQAWTRPGCSSWTVALPARILRGAALLPEAGFPLLLLLLRMCTDELSLLPQHLQLATEAILSSYLSLLSAYCQLQISRNMSRCQRDIFLDIWSCVINCLPLKHTAAPLIFANDKCAIVKYLLNWTKQGIHSVRLSPQSTKMSSFPVSKMFVHPHSGDQKFGYLKIGG